MVFRTPITKTTREEYAQWMEATEGFRRISELPFEKLCMPTKEERSKIKGKSAYGRDSFEVIRQSECGNERIKPDVAEKNGQWTDARKEGQGLQKIRGGRRSTLVGVEDIRTTERARENVECEANGNSFVDEPRRASVDSPGDMGGTRGTANSVLAIPGPSQTKGKNKKRNEWKRKFAFREEDAENDPTSPEEALDQILDIVPTHSGTITVIDRIILRRNAEYLKKATEKLRGELEELRATIKRTENSGIENGKGDDSIEGVFRKLATKLGFETRKKTVQRSPTYAEAAREGHGVVIESGEGGPAPDKVEEILRENILPHKAGIKIINMRSTKEGRVLIKGSTKSDAEKIKEIVRATPNVGLKARVQRRSWPRVAIKFVPAVMQDQDIKECLVGQDDQVKDAYPTREQLEKEFRIKGHIRNKRRPDTKMVIAEVSPALRKIIIDRRIFVGWGSALVVDHIDIMQCYRCYEFGHKSDRCAAKQGKCGRCAGDHDQRRCESSSMCCTLCTAANKENRNHEATDRNCPVRQRIIENIKNTIDYGP